MAKPTKERAPADRLKLPVYMLLAIMALVAFWSVFHNGFVAYDDNTYITENPAVSGGLTARSVVWAFTAFDASNWHPLTWLSHMLDCRLYGLAPMGHHATNLFLHIATSLLVFLVLRRMTSAEWPSFFVAAVFAIHPLHVESVAWVSERKDVLCAFFWMLTMWAYLRYTEKPGWRRYVLILLAFAAALMSKPMAVTLPFVLLLVDYWPLGRLTRTNVLRLVVEKVPLLALSAASCAITLVAQRQGGAMSNLDVVSLGHRIANMLTAYVLYFRNVLWPDRLAVLYPLAPLNTAFVVACAIIVVAATILSLMLARRRPYIVVGWLWYLGTLVPVIGLVQVGSQAMADRYMYIPIIGLAIAAAWAVKDVIARWPRARMPVAAVAIVVVAAMVAQTRIQVGYWHDSLTLFGRALKVTQHNLYAENGYGVALLRAGRPAEAEPHLVRAFNVEPAAQRADNKPWWLIGNNLSLAYLDQGKYDQAIVCLNKLAGKGPDSAEVQAKLAAAWVGKGDIARAKGYWDRARQLDCNDAQVLNNLAWQWATAMGVSGEDRARAVEYAQRACGMTGWRDANCMDTLAAAYAGVGKYDEAAAMGQRAVEVARKNGNEAMAAGIASRAAAWKKAKGTRQ